MSEKPADWSRNIRKTGVTYALICDWFINNDLASSLAHARNREPVPLNPNTNMHNYS